MIAGYILTGGGNRRMAGKRKLFLEYRGRPFLDHLRDALQQFPTLYLSVDREEPYRDLGLPLVRDLWPGQGPMGAIATGLKTCPEEALFVTACDTPLLDRATVESIVAAWDGGITLACADGRLQPLMGIYPKSALGEMEKRLAKGELRMYDCLRELGYTVTSLPPHSGAAKNINTPEDYRRLKESIEG